MAHETGLPFLVVTKFHLRSKFRRMQFKENHMTQLIVEPGSNILSVRTGHE